MSAYRTFRQLNELDAIRRADTMRQLPGSLPSDDNPTSNALAGILVAVLISVAIWALVATMVLL